MLVRRTTVWLPTGVGWLVLLGLLLGPVVFWVLAGEEILSADRVMTKEVLVVDGWIQEEPIQSAAQEFLRGGYQHVVAAGGINGEKWSKFRWSNADIARKGLMRAGVPPEKIIVAQAPDPEAHRTYVTAQAVWRSLEANGPLPRSITVYSRGPHALRSRLIFQKVFGPTTEVGVVSWKPPGSETQRWWRDSSRADEFVRESCAFLWEWLFDSGRRTSA